MRRILPHLLLTVVALVSGAILGYFVLDGPIIPIATDNVIQWLVPYLKDVNAWFYERGAQHLLVGSLICVAAIPNIVLLSVAVALVMKTLRRPRAVFYATLAWPVFHFIFDLEKVVRIMARLEQLGHNPGLETVLRAEGLPTKAASMFLVYVLFSVLVFALFHRLSSATRHPTAQDGRAG